MTLERSTAAALRTEGSSRAERRRAERRRRRRPVLRERRSGFERRTRGRSRAVAALEAPLAHLRDHPRSLVWVLIVANALSCLDLLLTMMLMGFGVAEANPVMRYFFENSVLQAAIVKCGMIAAASLAIWRLRRHRAALDAALLLIVAFAAVVAYELVGLAHILT